MDKFILILICFTVIVLGALILDAYKVRQTTKVQLEKIKKGDVENVNNR